MPAYILLFAFLAALLSGAAAACSSGSNESSSSDKTIWIYGASSLTDVLEELGENFEKSSDIKINFQFGGSSHLVQQINEGAPADILAVANEQVLNNLRDFSAAKIFAHSQLVIAVPKDNPKNITRLADLEDSKLLLGMCAREVPCGSLAISTFEKAGLRLNPDTQEASSRSVLNKLILGELDAGLIYEVDVLAANRVSERLASIPIRELPEAPENNYLAALIQENSAALDFSSYLTSQEAQNILLAHGFKLP